MGDSFVYVMGSSELGNRVKIGWSEAPERRMGQLQTGLPYELALLTKHPGPRALETFLKAEFVGFRIRGEWFNFGGQDPLLLVAEAVRRWADEGKDPRNAYTFDELRLSTLPKLDDLSPADRILTLHVHAPERHGGPLRWTRAKMAAYLGISLRTVATAIESLVEAGLLVVAERHGRLIYYRANPVVEQH